MTPYPIDTSLFLFDIPFVPDMAPVLGASKILEQESDFTYLKNLYPQIARSILPCIEEEADKMEYEGSPMFDEYPDKEYFRRIACRIYNKCALLLEPNPAKPCPETKRSPVDMPKVNNSLYSLTEVLLFYEIMFRRNRYRSRKRLYY